MRAPRIARLEVSREELDEILHEARGALSAAHYQTLEQVVRTFVYLTTLLEDTRTTIARLRRLLVGPRSETTRAVLGAQKPAEAPGLGAATAADGDPPGGTPAGENGLPASKAKRKGHGRHGAAAYTGAERIDVAHAGLKPRDRCPGCQKGKVYRLDDPGVLVRVRGQAPLAATVWALEKLRCNLCGEVFTATPPAGVGPETYDAGAKAMIALLRYGNGFPFHRLERLEANLGIPLPAATQWELVAAVAATAAPVHTELIRQAAQGEVVHNDDTPARILSLGPASAADADGRRAVVTSGIVSVGNGHRVALVVTGRRHAGENLAMVLQERAAELGPPIQMCDALARNAPRTLKSRLANCLAPGRRKFVELLKLFPAECRHVLESLRSVYRTDKHCREEKLSADERLQQHQAESGPVMAELKGWLEAQLAAHTVEPNSGLGQAFRYLLKHWAKLTLFLREPGAPLDNNICERALKKAIQHRKNSLFYKTENGARVGDLFMTLIHTCELEGVNAFEYLVALQQHAKEVAAHPGDWLPWTYRATLERMGRS